MDKYEIDCMTLTMISETGSCSQLTNKRILTKNGFNHKKKLLFSFVLMSKVFHSTVRLLTIPNYYMVRATRFFFYVEAECGIAGQLLH